MPTNTKTAAKKRQRTAAKPTKTATPPDIATLWARYGRRRTVANRNLIVERYIPYALTVARMMRPKLKMDQATLNAEVQFALIGCVEKYDPWRGNTFETYSRPRLVGACLDAARGLDCESRARRLTDRHWQERKAEVQVAESAALSTEQIEAAIGRRPVSHFMVSLFSSREDDGREESHTDARIERCRPRHVAFRFWALTDGLDRLEQFVIYSLFVLGHTQQEVAQFLYYSDARVSQILQAAIGKLRQKTDDPQAKDALLDIFYYSRNVPDESTLSYEE